MIAPGAVVSVGLSGGVDSVVLLDILRQLRKRYRFRLNVLHVHHGLSPNADRWARFCATHCARRAIPFQCVRVEVKGQGKNIEAHARAARYEAFARHGSEVIALAHNLNDQAETVLLNLVRGAAAHGMRGMAAVRSTTSASKSGRQTIIRPLLDVPRSSLVEYANHRRLRFIVDESNADHRFARNFIRLRITPLLERRFPGSQGAIARTAGLLAEGAMLLDELADLDLQSVAVGDRLDAERLCALTPARAANVLRRYLGKRGVMSPPSVRLHEVLRQIRARDDAAPVIQVGQVSIRRFRGMVDVVPDKPGSHSISPIMWQGEPRIELPDGASLVFARKRGIGIRESALRDASITIRSRTGGERIRIARNGRTRTLKNLLSEGEVPPWQRAAMPLIFRDGKLIWAPLVGYAAEFVANDREKSIAFTWITSIPNPVAP